MVTIDARVRAGVEGRSRVENLIRSNVGQAVEEARAIAHPWYRCQSLTRAAAELKKPDSADALLREALAAAHEQAEPNRIVTVAAWPIRVLVQRGAAGVANEVERLLRIIAPEPNPIRRADALLMLLGAVFPDAALRRRVLEPLLAACLASRGWKGRRILQFTAALMAGESREAAERVLALIPPSKERKRAESLVRATLRNAGVLAG
jgi:hypothetical protein